MKNSGIEWIGEMPSHWKVSAIKNYCKNVFAGGTPQSNNAEYWDGDIPWIPSGSCHDCKIISAPKYITEIGLENSSTKMIPANTAVVAMTGATCGNTGYLTFDSCANQSVTAYVAKDSSYPLFIWYLIQAAKEHLLTFQTGGAQGGVNVENCKNIIVPYISYDEQKRIADYLDEKCAKIDAAIEKQKQVIEKLKEYKLSVITEAVTKGLDPTVPMKDSGVEWIGEIPEGWKVAKLSNLFDFLGGYAFNSDLYTSESNNLVVRIGNVKNDKLLIDANPVYISDELARQVGKFKLKSQDIVFTMTGTKGKRDYFYTKLLDESDISKKDLYLNQRVGCFRAKENIYAKYYCYLLKEPRILDSVFLYETGTANQGNLGIDSIGRTRVHMPSYEEQIEIAEYLHQKCSEIDSAISKKQAIVEKLAEYKKSLIYEVVTGKREV